MLIMQQNRYKDGSHKKRKRMPENYSDIPLLLHLKLREIEIIVLYVRNNVCIVHKYHTPA